MNVALSVLALVTGLVTGGVFAALEAPIPAPPNLAGVLGIVGIYLGYVAINSTGYSIDVISMVGLG